MFATSTLITFLLASIAIILTPGPAQALVLARTISDGKKAGILTAVGLNVGTMVHALAAAVGISAILAASANLCC
jgi:threonine/homoserine/homoserine lactone efflux protein